MIFESVKSISPFNSSNITKYPFGESLVTCQVDYNLRKKFRIGITVINHNTYYKEKVIVISYFQTDGKIRSAEIGPIQKSSFRSYFTTKIITHGEIINAFLKLTGNGISI